MVHAEDVLSICQYLAAKGVEIWLLGGWGIDALLGEQTRPHKDLDIFVRLDDVIQMRKLLGGKGYGLKEIWSENRRATDAQGIETATAFVLQDSAGRKIDVHALDLDDRGNGIPRWEARGRIFERLELAGEGVIAGVAVRCLTAEAQAACHVGYPLPDAHRQDLDLLRQKFDVEYPNAHTLVR